MQRVFISISGQKQSGKDTAGNFFRGFGFEKVNWADNLKTMCSGAFDIPLEHFYDDDLKERNFLSPVTIQQEHIDFLNKWIRHSHTFSIPMSHLGEPLASPREVMQYVGVDMIRAVFPRYHVEVSMPLMEDCGLLVCCDSRFQDEIEAIKSLAARNNADFFSIYIVRPGENKDGHATETSVTPDMCDHVVINDWSVESLHQKLDALAAIRLKEVLTSVA